MRILISLYWLMYKNISLFIILLTYSETSHICPCDLELSHISCLDLTLCTNALFVMFHWENKLRDKTYFLSLEICISCIVSATQWEGTTALFAIYHFGIPHLTIWWFNRCINIVTGLQIVYVPSRTDLRQYL